VSENQFTASSRYSTLEQARTAPLKRARENSRLTLPWVLPPEGAKEDSELYDPFQNVGSRGTNHLASKMTLAVMPPNEPFFRHDADDFAAEEAEGEQPGTLLDAQQKLAKYDRTVMKRIEASGDRPKFELTMKHLLITGNVLLDINEPQSRVIGLDSYVVQRDPRGKIVELVVKEEVHPNALPEAVRLQLQNSENGDKSKPAGDKELLELYTHSQLVGGFYEGFQEVNGEKVAGSEFKKKPEDFGYIALRFAVIDGQSYGRSFVETLYGDLRSLEVLTQAITDGASMASKVLFLVRANGTTRVRDLQDAGNGDFVTGEAADITTLQLNKSADMQYAASLADTLREGLKEQFLLRSSVTRDAERVTAEEIRYVALEIEDALSGIYSLLTHELQAPYVRLKIRQMKGLPTLPKELVNLTITTGLEALRRGHEMQKLRAFIGGLAEAYGPDAVKEFIPISTYAKRLGDALGLDLMGLIVSEQEAKQKRVEEQVTQAGIQSAPQIIQEGLQQ